ncbi:MAG: hypothetical protein ACRD12_01795 [Acidimicrobiales bacterium]
MTPSATWPPSWAAGSVAHIRCYVIVGAQCDVGEVDGIVLRDGDGAFRRAYGAADGCAYLIRPDGYVGYRTTQLDATRVLSHLSGTIRI